MKPNFLLSIVCLFGWISPLFSQAPLQEPQVQPLSASTNSSADSLQLMDAKDSMSSIDSADSMDFTDSVNLKDSLNLMDSISTSQDTLAPLKHFPTADTALGAFHLGLFVEARLQFINFEDRKVFQQHLDTLYTRARRDTFNIQQGIRINKVDFQKVNLTLPVSVGFEMPIGSFFRAGASVGILYTRETALLLEGSRTRQLDYQIWWFPLQYELQLNLSELLILSPDFPQLFLDAHLNQITGQARLEYEGLVSHSKSWELLGGGFSFGGRRKISDEIELETQLGIDFQSLTFDKKWSALWDEYPAEREIQPHLNTFWFALRLLYKI